MKSHKYSKTNSLGLAQKPNISHKRQEPLQSGAPPGSHIEEKNCSGTFPDKLFCNMEYVSMKVSHHFNKKRSSREDVFCMGHPLR